MQEVGSGEQNPEDPDNIYVTVISLEARTIYSILMGHVTNTTTFKADNHLPMVGSSPYSFSLSECHPIWSLPSRYKLSRHELNSTPAISCNLALQNQPSCQLLVLPRESGAKTGEASRAMYLDLRYLWMPIIRLHLCM